MSVECIKPSKNHLKFSDQKTVFIFIHIFDMSWNIIFPRCTCIYIIHMYYYYDMLFSSIWLNLRYFYVPFNMLMLAFSNSITDNDRKIKNNYNVHMYVVLRIVMIIILIFSVSWFWHWIIEQWRKIAWPARSCPAGSCRFGWARNGPHNIRVWIGKQRERFSLERCWAARHNRIWHDTGIRWYAYI